MSLFGELKRRNVIRVGIAYLVLAWVLLQVGDVVFEALRLDASANTLLLAILALGFIPAMIFAWVFELTPDGLQKDTGAAGSESLATAKKLDVAVIVLVLLGIGLLAADRFIAPTNAPDTQVTGQADLETTTDPNGNRAAVSIAVLPFADMSAEGDQAYFGDGIAEELLNLLAQIDGLKVAARTSSFKFRDGDADVAEIGQALNVGTVLEGSVRKAGDQIRITAQLIDADEGYHLWSESYDRKLENIFAVQDEIAASIVSALRLELDMEVQTTTQTRNVEAYDAYLRARELSRTPTRDGLLKALDLYNKAVDMDPEFAEAHGGIAEAWVWLEDYGGVKSVEAFPKAERAARRALELEPDQAEGLTAMGFVQDRYYNDVTAAAASFRRSIELHPTYVNAYNLLAESLIDMGETDEAIAVRRDALALDPQDLWLQSRLASVLVDKSTTKQEGRDILDALLEEHPDYDYALEERANYFLFEREYSRAAADYQAVHNSRPGDPYSAANLAIIGTCISDIDMANAWLQAARERGEDNRWQLFAEEFVTHYQGDWQALEEVGARRGGQAGAMIRADALMRQGRLAEARQDYVTSLRLSGFREGQPVTVLIYKSLIGLAWLEKQDGVTGWQSRADAAEAFLRHALDQNMVITGVHDHVRFQLARIHALHGDREQTLDQLQQAVEEGFGQHWFLENDPFFEAWRNDPEFMAVVTGMREHAAQERAQMSPEVLSP